MKYKLCYKDFKKKAVTFSYDDGTFYDVFLAEILNKYKLKCTFNINSGLFGEMAYIDFGNKIVYHNRISKQQSKMIYKGHEIASHSLTHPLLINQPKEFLDEQVLIDIKNLEEISGTKITGFAYPGGPHDEFTDNYLKDKVLFARSAKNSYSFKLPNSFVPFDPTVFHMDKEFINICDKYISTNFDEISWLYIWGHSYEFSLGDTYKNFISVCKKLSKQKNVWFATNSDIINYVQNARKLKIEDNKFINDTDSDIFIEYNDKQIKILARTNKKID